MDGLDFIVPQLDGIVYDLCSLEKKSEILLPGLAFSSYC